MGLKIITINADMQRRKIRYRPASYSDLIAFNYYLKININIDEPPYKYIVQGQEKSYNTKEEILSLLKKIKFYLKNRYNLLFNIKQISKLIKLKKNRYNSLLEI
jgi:hypothetical protein